MACSQVSCAAPFAQVLPESVIIRNTFIDVDMLDSDMDWCRDRRTAKTCPGVIDASVEPGSDSEMSPGRFSAQDVECAEAVCPDASAELNPECQDDGIEGQPRGRVTIKNTFIDVDVCDSDDDWCRNARSNRTCPDVIGACADPGADAEIT